VEVSTVTFYPCTEQFPWCHGYLILACHDHRLELDSASPYRRIAIFYLIERRNHRTWYEPMIPALSGVDELPFPLIT
jgi:hypothetical protein